MNTKIIETINQLRFCPYCNPDYEKEKETSNEININPKEVGR